MRLTTRTFCLALASIFLLAFVLRVGLAVKFVGLDSPPDMDANPDQFEYELNAYQITQGIGMATTTGEPSALRTPGTALTLAPAYALFGRSYAAGRILFCLISAATCLAAAWVALQLAGRGAAILAAALLAVYPGHAYYAMHFLSEVPYCFYLAFAVALTIHVYQQGGKWAGLFSGICWGMAMHCRPQLILLLPIAMIAMLVLYRKMDRTQWVAAMRIWAVQTCIVTAIILPWFVRNAVVMGKPVFTTIAGHGLWGVHNPLTFNDPSVRGDWVRVSDLERMFGKLPQGELAKDAEASRRGWESIAVNFPRLPQLVMYKLGRFLSPFMATPNQTVRWAFALSWIAVVPFMLIGGWQIWKRAKSKAFIFFLPIAATFATVVSFYGSIRFRDSIAPLFITMAGIGAAKLLAMIAGLRAVKTDTTENAPPHNLVLPQGEHRRAA